MSSLREQAGMYVESIQAKDQIIVSLTNGLHQLELDQSVTTGQSSISPAVPDVRPSLRFISDTRELDELKVSNGTVQTFGLNTSVQLNTFLSILSYFINDWIYFCLFVEFVLLGSRVSIWVKMCYKCIYN